MQAISHSTDFQNNTNDDTWQHIENPITPFEDEIEGVQSPTSSEELVMSTAFASNTSKAVEGIEELFYRVALLEEQLCYSRMQAQARDQYIDEQSNKILQLTNRVVIAENKPSKSESINTDVTSLATTATDVQECVNIVQNPAFASLVDRMNNVEQTLKDLTVRFQATRVDIREPTTQPRADGEVSYVSDNVNSCIGDAVQYTCDLHEDKQLQPSTVLDDVEQRVTSLEVQLSSIEKHCPGMVKAATIEKKVSMQNKLNGIRSSIQSMQSQISALEDSSAATDLLTYIHSDSQENIEHTETRIRDNVNQKFDELYRDLESRDEHYAKIDATLRVITSSMTNLTNEFYHLQVLVYAQDDKLESLEL